MPQSAGSPSRARGARAKYSYRRELSLTELLPAVGVAIGAGLLAFYVAKLLLQRTPLDVEPLPEGGRRPPVTKGTRWRTWGERGVRAGRGTPERSRDE